MNGGRPRPSRLLISLAVGSAVAVAAIGARKLLQRRRAGDGNDAKPASTKNNRPTDDERPADLATELRAAAGELTLTLLDCATDRLQRVKP